MSKRNEHSWLDFWSNSDNPIYCCPRHLEAHYALIARNITDQISENNMEILDFGCGYATHANFIAQKCKQLILVEDSQSISAFLKAQPLEKNISVIHSKEINAIKDNSLNLITVNSVLQYLPDDVRAQLFQLWSQKLKTGGRLLIADVIPPSQSLLADVVSLLKFALKGGFLIKAFISLFKIKFSNYSKIKSELGLKTFTAQQIIAELNEVGLTAAQQTPNFGHNQNRMMFVGIKS